LGESKRNKLANQLMASETLHNSPTGRQEGLQRAQEQDVTQLWWYVTWQWCLWIIHGQAGRTIVAAAEYQRHTPIKPQASLMDRVMQQTKQQHQKAPEGLHIAIES